MISQVINVGYMFCIHGIQAAHLLSIISSILLCTIEQCKLHKKVLFSWIQMLSEEFNVKTEALSNS